MNLSLRNLALVAGLTASGAIFAQGNVIFEDDFEWLAPWAEAGKCGDTVGEDNESANSPQITAAKVGDESALNVLEAKGYVMLRTHDEGKKDGECIYLNKNYLKFGKTSYQSGLTLPALVGANGTVTLDFDWSSQRRTNADKTWDETNLVVIVKNGDSEKQYVVPAHTYANGDQYQWLHASMVLEDVTENSAVSIRNIDGEWANGTHRYFLDNIKVTAEAPAETAGATLTTVWKSHNGITANVRGGNGLNGKVYVVDGANINTIDKDGNVETVFTAEGLNMNKGLFVDEAGNMLVAKSFPTSKANWMNFLLISADGQTVKDITIRAPKNDDKWVAFDDNRSDLAHRAIGDFFSEEGGLCYLPGQKATYPLPIYIAEGEFVQGDYSTGAAFTAANSTAYAIPAIESMDEFDQDEMRNTFYYYTGNATWQVGYVNEDGEAAYLPTPNSETTDGVTTYPGLPEGWKQQTQNGFDVITLQGKKYIFRMVGPGTWCPDFLIQDEDGNIVAHTDYMLNDDGYGITGSAGYGCGIFARKINDSKAEIYQVFKAGDISKSFVAMYTFEVPAPELYLAGQFQGWNPENPAVFTFDGENYVYEFEKEAGGMKISTVKGDWDTFNSGVLGVEGQNISAGNTYNLVPGYSEDIQLPAGKYTLTVNLDELTLNVEGEEFFTAPELFLRGAFNEWGYSEATKFASDYTVNEEGNVIYTLSLDALEGEFKLATTDWTTSYGKGQQNITANGTFTLAFNGENLTAPAMKNVELTFTLPNTSEKPATLTVSSRADRKAFAYEVKATLGDNNNVALTYKASAPAKSAAFVVTDAAGTSTSFELPAPVKGANEATVALTGLETGEYTYAVELISELAGEEAALAYKAPEEWVASGAQYGGPVFIRDTREAAFGYVVVGMSGAKGFAVYNPEGELMYDGPIHANYEKFAHGNSEIMGGDAHKGYAVFSNWNDKGSAAWLVNPLDATEQPRGIFETEGATCDGNGLWSLNGVELGGGQTGIAFQDNGEESMMFTFDEDLVVDGKKNVVHGYKIGEATSVVAAPVVSFTANSGKFGSNNVQLKAVKNGVFTAQRRADGNDANVPALMYFDNEGTLIWDSGNKNVINPTGTAQGIAINNDETILAMGTWEGNIDVYQMEYDSYDEPVFTKWLTIPMEKQLSGNTIMAATFDAADNLLVYNRHAYGYHVFALPGESTASTKGNDTLNITNGVENISIDANAPVEYFNLQGIRVENPSNGIFIRRQGNTATKVTL